MIAYNNIIPQVKKATIIDIGIISQNQFSFTSITYSTKALGIYHRVFTYFIPKLFINNFAQYGGVKILDATPFNKMFLVLYIYFCLIEDSFLPTLFINCFISIPNSSKDAFFDFSIIIYCISCF